MMGNRNTYTGPVCYQDGWHYTVDLDGRPGDRLFLDENGAYRPAQEGDRSWHDRTHGRFATIQLEDGQPAVTVTEDELAAIKTLLEQRRGQ